MATRMYFASVATAPVSPTLGATGVWTSTAGADRRKLMQAPRDSASSTQSRFDSGTPPRSRLVRQYVSDALSGAGTLSGTVRLQVTCRETNAAMDCDLAAVIYVVSNDGVTVRGTAINLISSSLGTELDTSLTNRALSGTLTNVNYQDGDRIVVELGYKKYAAGNGSISEVFGDWQGIDLPQNETCVMNDRPWVEFSQDLVFQAPEHRRYWMSDNNALGALPSTAQGTHSYHGGTLNAKNPARLDNVYFAEHTIATAVTGLITRTYWRHAAFFSHRLAAQTVPAGTWKVVVRVNSSAAPLNGFSLTAYLYLVGKDGTKRAEIGYTDEVGFTAVSPAFEDVTLSISPGAVAIQDGDRLGIEVEIIDEENAGGPLTVTTQWGLGGDYGYVAPPKKLGMTMLGAGYDTLGVYSSAAGEFTHFMRLEVDDALAGWVPKQIVVGARIKSGYLGDGTGKMNAAYYTSHEAGGVDEPLALVAQSTEQTVVWEPLGEGAYHTYEVAGTAVTAGQKLWLAIQIDSTDIELKQHNADEYSTLCETDGTAAYGSWPAPPTILNYNQDVAYSAYLILEKSGGRLRTLRGVGL